MQDCQNWFYITLALAGIILALLAMFFNYNLKLDKRTLSCFPLSPYILVYIYT